MAKEDYMTFNEVLEELQVSEEELQRLVSDVKLRAFRIQNTLKFKRIDVSNLKRQWETNVTKVIPPGQLSDTTSGGETLLEMPQEKPAGKPAGKPAAKPAAAPKGGAPAAKGKAAAASEPVVEEELGTQLYFEELPLGEGEKPAAAPPTASPSADTNVSLESLDAGVEGGDELTDTVIPTIELSTEQDSSDDTTDTVIPTIELSTNDLTDDTSDTVIPTIELSAQGAGETESTATAFPTIELGAGDAAQSSETGAITADIQFEELSPEAAQDTQKLGFTTDTSEMDLAATKTEEQIPTFDESAASADTQQEATAAVGFQDPSAASADTAAVEAQAESGDEAGTAEVGVAAPPITISLWSFLALLPTLLVLAFAGVILASAVAVIAGDFRSPDYLDKVLEIVREYVIPKLPQLV